MASRREYEVSIGGLRHTFRLTEEQAKERGLTDGDLKQGKSQNKGRTPRNK